MKCGLRTARLPLSSLNGRRARLVATFGLINEAKEREISETVSSSSQRSTSFYTPRLRTLRRHAGWCSYDDLSTFDPPRAVLPSEVFRNVVTNLESVERIFDLDGTDVYINERSLHILYLVRSSLAGAHL